MSAEEFVRAKIESAGKTLMLFPIGFGKPQGHRSNWPEAARELIVYMQDDGKGLEIIMPDVEVMREKASMREVTELEEVIGWIQDYASYCKRRNIRAACVQLMWDAMRHHRLTGRRIWSWRRLGKKYGISYETARNWYEGGISRIAIIQHEKGGSKNLF